MNKLLQNITLFFIPILITSYFLDLFISNHLKKSHKFLGEIEVWEDIYNERIKCDIAIYGSSRAWVHIDPEVIKDSTGLSAYNFGFDGHNFLLQYYRHKEYIKHSPKPKTIILSVDAFTLEKKEDLYNQNQFLPYMLWNDALRKYTSSYIGYEKLDYYIPLIRYFGKRSTYPSLGSMFSKNKESAFRINGYKGMDRQWNSDFDDAKNKLDKYCIKHDTFSIDLFENFILECKDSNIELIFVYAPEYIKGQNFIKNREININIFSNLAYKYQILFLDYSNHKICSNKSLFYNTMHLNKEGADLFTKILVNDIKNSGTSSYIKNGTENVK